jgi:L-amino acid N-acyltransferase YncA
MFVMEQQIQIRPFAPSDFPRVMAIYQQGIDSGIATFQTHVKTWDEWNQGMLPVCRLVAESHGEVVGWAALSGVSSRCVYAGVAEVSIYVAESARGQGVGKTLLAALVSASEQEGFWTLQSGIFASNQASIALHRSQGFELLGIRKKLGQLHGQWRDIALMERRSMVVGVD